MKSRVMKLMKLSVFIANRQFFCVVYSCRRLYQEVTKKSIIIFTKENIFFVRISFCWVILQSKSNNISYDDPVFTVPPRKWSSHFLSKQKCTGIAVSKYSETTGVKECCEQVRINGHITTTSKYIEKYFHGCWVTNDLQLFLKGETW